MIIFKGQLNKKEKTNVQILLEEMNDIYGDFYITRDNLRLFIKENIDLLYKCLKQGDKIIYGEEEGVALIIGWSDNSKRHYLKILSRNLKVADKLIKVALWNINNIDIWCKIKKNNPILEVLENNNFKYYGSRGKEILLVRKVYNKEIKNA